MKGEKSKAEKSNQQQSRIRLVGVRNAENPKLSDSVSRRRSRKRRRNERDGRWKEDG
jgi:hypothetical protein